MRLGQLRQGQKAVITQTPASSGVGNRMIEFGFVVGAELEILAEAPFGGDPILVRIFGARIAIRRNDADLIEVALA